MSIRATPSLSGTAVKLDVKSAVVEATSSPLTATLYTFRAYGSLMQQSSLFADVLTTYEHDPMLFDHDDSKYPPPGSVVL